MSLPLHKFVDIFDSAESSETKGVLKAGGVVHWKFDFFIFASCTTTSQKHVALVLSPF